MPARDAIHDAVKNALIEDGWQITDDPYIINYDDLMLFADLGAERTLAIERDKEKAVVEAKSFSGGSETQQFETALGQYIMYRVLLSRIEPERRAYLAIDETVFQEFFSRPAIRMVCEECRVGLIVIDLEAEEIRSWHQP